MAMPLMRYLLAAELAMVELVATGPEEDLATVVVATGVTVDAA